MQIYFKIFRKALLIYQLILATLFFIGSYMLAFNISNNTTSNTSIVLVTFSIYRTKKEPTM